MKRRILSIDFDYFIDTDVDTRNDKFPDGMDVKPKDRLERDWKEFIHEYKEIKRIGVIDNYKTCCDFLCMLQSGKVLISDTHKDIAKLFPLINPKSDLEVINIDFHHDNYISSINKVDCANWVRHLMYAFPNTEFTWIRREDSELNSLLGNFPYFHTRDFVLEGEFDYIFICFSPEWTPPHLRAQYKNLCKNVAHLEHL